MQQIECLFRGIFPIELDGITIFVGMKVPIDNRDAVMSFQRLEDIVQGSILEEQRFFLPSGDFGRDDAYAARFFVYDHFPVGRERILFAVRQSDFYFALFQADGCLLVFRVIRNPEDGSHYLYNAGVRLYDKWFAAVFSDGQPCFAGKTDLSQIALKPLGIT